VWRMARAQEDVEVDLTSRVGVMTGVTKAETVAVTMKINVKLLQNPQLNMIPKKPQ